MSIAIKYRAPDYKIKTITLASLRYVGDLELVNRANFIIDKIKNEAKATISGAIREDYNELNISEGIISTNIKRYTDVYSQVELKYDGLSRNAKLKTRVKARKQARAKASGIDIYFEKPLTQDTIQEPVNEQTSKTADPVKPRSGYAGMIRKLVKPDADINPAKRADINRYRSIPDEVYDPGETVKSIVAIEDINTNAFGNEAGLPSKLSVGNTGDYVMVTESLNATIKQGTNGILSVKGETNQSDTFIEEKKQDTNLILIIAGIGILVYIL